MTAVSIILRITIFLAIVVPVLVLVVRRARVAKQSPADRTVDRHTELGRGHHGTNPGGGTTGI